MFFPISSHKDRKTSLKRPIALLGVVACSTFLYQQLVIVKNISTPFQKISVIHYNYNYCCPIHLTDFIFITFYWVSVIGFISSTKIRNNKEEAPFGIPGVSTEHENNLRFKLIVKSKIFFLLKIDQYSCD